MTLKNHLRLFANKMLKPIGLTLQRTETEATLAQLQKSRQRKNLNGMLQHARQIGFIPATVLDVGAAYGTPDLYQVFPQSHHLLLEPLEEYEPALKKWVATYTHLDYILAAASDHDKGVTIHVDPSKVGASIYQHKISKEITITQRDIATVRLDKVCMERNLPKPYLIKIDVQGAELDVVRGATDILNDTEYIVMETSFFEFNEKMPQLYDIITFMKTLGFVAYDMSEGTYRPLDGAMAQIDIAFVKEEGLFRQTHEYATADQFRDVYEEIKKYSNTISG